MNTKKRKEKGGGKKVKRSKKTNKTKGGETKEQGGKKPN
jgi:hypothetical protein